MYCTASVYIKITYNGTSLRALPELRKPGQRILAPAGPPHYVQKQKKLVLKYPLCMATVCTLSSISMQCKKKAVTIPHLPV